MPRSVRASVKMITIIAHQALTNIVNTSIACFGVVIMIEFVVASYTYTIHLVLNKYIILVSSISILFASLSTFASNELKSFEPNLI